MKINPHDPAFPVTRTIKRSGPDDEQITDTIQYPGMSIRAWLTGQAMAGGRTALDALRFADTAIQQLNRDLP